MDSLSPLPNLPAPYVAHLVDPVGWGDLDEADTIGQAGSMIGGMGVRVSLAFRDGLEPDGTIERAKGVVVSGIAARAPLSMAVFSLQGAPSSAAYRIRPPDLLALLRGSESAFAFPDAVMRGAEMVVEAIRRAVDASEEEGPGDSGGKGLLVCRCIGVGDKPIREAIRAGASSIDQVARASGAYGGCRSCRPELLQLIHEERVPREVHVHERDPLVRIVHAVIAPQLRALGQRVVHVARTERTVSIGTRPSRRLPDVSEIGAQAISRNMLRDLVADDIEVTLSRH